MIRKNQKGFTLIELLIVVAIIGILAAIAIPNLLTAMQRAKQKRSMADMRTIATAWEARATDMNRYNAAGACSIPGTAITSGMVVLARSGLVVPWSCMRSLAGTDAVAGDGRVAGVNSSRYSSTSCNVNAAVDSGATA